jgi:hypothetical protein
MSASAYDSLEGEDFLLGPEGAEMVKGVRIKPPDWEKDFEKPEAVPAEILDIPIHSEAALK